MWRKLCHETGGEYEDGGFWKGDKVHVKVKDWTVTLDTYTVSNGQHSTTYTRLRAPFINKDGFHFCIYRKSFFSGMGKMLGMQDITVGHPRFDEDFIIKSNNERKVKQLFDHRELRTMIMSHPRFRLQIKDDEGWFGSEFPEGVDALYYTVSGVNKDVEQLKSLFQIFGLTLHLLCHLDSAYEDDPQVVLK